MENELEQIQERNKRVELDKAWETSLFRRGIIAVLTYVFASIWLMQIGNAEPFKNALVPMGGYLLSTLSLVCMKQAWIEYFK